MIKKAVKRPDEVEYIEFKGRENFEEVANFINEPSALFTTPDGREQLMLGYNISNDRPIKYHVGTIFYRWYDFNVMDIAHGIYRDKDEFFKRYKED